MKVGSCKEGKKCVFYQKDECCEERLVFRDIFETDNFFFIIKAAYHLQKYSRVVIVVNDTDTKKKKCKIDTADMLANIQ